MALWPWSGSGKHSSRAQLANGMGIKELPGEAEGQAYDIVVHSKYATSRRPIARSKPQVEVHMLTEEEVTKEKPVGDKSVTVESEVATEKGGQLEASKETPVVGELRPREEARGQQLQRGRGAVAVKKESVGAEAAAVGPHVTSGRRESRG